jgi:hypothetical protein
MGVGGLGLFGKLAAHVFGCSGIVRVSQIPISAKPSNWIV